MVLGTTGHEVQQFVKRSSVKLAVALLLVARKVGRVIQLTLFTGLGLLLVAVSALLISIIQFQIRIIEAKNQSKNFELTSLTQTVEMQRDLVESIKFVQSHELVIVGYESLQSTYFPRLSQIAVLICSADILKKDKPAQDLCAIGIAQALMNGAAPSFVDGMFEYYTGNVIEKFPTPMKTAIGEAAKIASARQVFESENGSTIVTFRAKCSLIERYIKVAIPNEVLGSTMLTSAEKVPWIASFSWEYIQSARSLCAPHFGLGTAAPSPEVQSKLIKAVADQQEKIGASPGELKGPMLSPLPTPDDGKKRDNLRSDISGALLFDLMAYYSFYQNQLTKVGFNGGYWAAQIVIAPIEITFVLLVIICGALGAMLRLAASKYNPALFGKDMSEMKGPMVYYFIIGIMCALITYIIAKTAFAGVTDASYSSKSGNLSPFVTAFLAIISGLMCEEAFHQIMTAGKAVLARSTGGVGGKRHNAGKDKPKRPSP